MRKLCKLFQILQRSGGRTKISFEEFIRRFPKFLQQSFTSTAKKMGTIIDKMSSGQGVDMTNPKAKFVVETINKEKVVIFSKTYCPYCVMAKEQFDKLKYPFYAVELDKRDDGEEIQNVLLQMTGARSVPRVFINGKFVGGGTDVKKLYENGSLKRMIES